MNSANLVSEVAMQKNCYAKVARITETRNQSVAAIKNKICLWSPRLTETNNIPLHVLELS